VLVNKFFCLAQFEFLNPLAGLVMVIAGLLLLIYGYSLIAIPPILVGLFLVAFYRKFLFQLMGG
jgi:hypothetical protein